MTLLSLFFYLISALILFFILNYFDRLEKNDDTVHIIVSLVFITIISGIFMSLELKITTNIFLIIIFELLIRLYYSSMVLNKDTLKNKDYYFKIYGITIILAYLLNNLFINNVENVLPNPEQFKIILWFLIMIFSYYLLKKYITVKSTKEKVAVKEKTSEYFIMNYAKLKNSFGYLIKENKLVANIIYTIMVYENYKRPEPMRKIDYFLFRIDKKPRKMGIMQIESKKYLTDVESIEIAIKKVNTIYSKEKSSKNKLENILKKYYKKEYSTEILDIYNKIIDFSKN